MIDPYKIYPKWTQKIPQKSNKNTSEIMIDTLSSKYSRWFKECGLGRQHPKSLGLAYCLSPHPWRTWALARSPSPCGVHPSTLVDYGAHPESNMFGYQQYT